ncbi:VWA domain-containing protein [Agaribacterium sp. ZY112]|uniref:VWA domain-containing protein n=1 Tax=Agaribacterium sp. ZY112 TaxID=3233574 RepID=UPI00352434BF
MSVSRALISGLLCCLLPLYASSALAEPRANVMILMDASGSVGEESFELQKQFVSDLAGSFDSEQARVGVIQFSTGAEILHSLGDVQEPGVLEPIIEGAIYSKGATFTRTAIKLALNDFDRYTADDDKRILVLVTDGTPYPRNTEDVCSLAHSLNSRSIEVVALLVGDNVNLQKLACITPSEKNLVLVKDFEALATGADGSGDVLAGPVVLRDFDLDGVANKDELLEDTDADDLPNYIDSDDDNDGIPTLSEDLNANGILSDDDSDRDGIAEYLDDEETQPAVTAYAGADQIVLDEVVLDASASVVLAGQENARYTWFIQHLCQAPALCESDFSVNGMVAVVDLVQAGNYNVRLYVEDITGESHSDSLHVAAYGEAYTPEEVDQLVAAAVEEALAGGASPSPSPSPVASPSPSPSPVVSPSPSPSPSVSPAPAVPLAVEGENFFNTGGTQDGFTTRTFWEGSERETTFADHILTGGWAEYSVSFPEDGSYDLSIIASTDRLTDSNVKVYIDGIEVAEAPVHGDNLNVFVEFDVASALSISEGDHVIRIESTGVELRWQFFLDKIVFTQN